MSFDTHIQSLLAIRDHRRRRLEDAARSGTSEPLGNRWAFLGDSITAGGTGNTDRFQANSWPLWVQLLSGGRIYMRNAGKGGDRTDHMLARFDTDVTPFRPNVVVFMGGANDIGQGRAFEDYQDTVKAVHLKTRAIGAAFVLCTMTPLNDDTNNAEVVRWNQWLSWYALRHGLHLVDHYSAIVDPTTGDIRAEYDADGVHPNNFARKEQGRITWEKLAAHTRAWEPPLVRSAADTYAAPWSTNLVLTDDSNGDGIADSWNGYGSGAGRVFSRTTHPDVVGNATHVQVAAGEFHAFTRAMDITNWEPGDTLWVGGKLFADTTRVTAQLIFRDADGNRWTATPVRIEDTTVEAGTFGYEVVVPESHYAGIATYEVIVGIGTTGKAGSGGFAQPTVVNLTRLGIV